MPENKAVEKALQLPRAERQRLVTQIAITQGVYASLQAAAVWSPICAGLKYGTSPNFWFNKSMNTSARTAMVIMPPLVAFVFVSEQVATRLANPDAFVSAIAEKRATTLGPFKRFANYTLDRPFHLLVAASVPIVGVIAYHNRQRSTLSLSQAIMHTRVMGQFSVLAILVTTMGFYDYMRAHGRYLEPWEVKDKTSSP
jgi:hypothetical protein